MNWFLHFSPARLCGVLLFECAAHVNLNICFELHMLASNLQIYMDDGALFKILLPLPLYRSPLFTQSLGGTAYN